MFKYQFVFFYIMLFHHDYNHQSFALAKPYRYNVI